MAKRVARLLALSTALAGPFLITTPAFSQTTPGDRSGTPSLAGTGQSAASSTQAPAEQGASPQSTIGAPETDPTARAAPSGNAGAIGTGRSDVGSRRAAADNGSGDIIVTARRVEERLQDVPISITVFNQQQLTNRNIINASDLATYTPSLSSNTNFGSQNTSFAIRGFVQDIGTQPSVGVYFADVVAPRAASNNIPAGDGAGAGSFFDLQNVQVLKGPQGTLFGRNTTGGAVLLVPQKPTSRLEGYIEGSYGSHNMYRTQAVVNVPLSDTARFRLGFDHETRDGYLRNDTGIGANRFDDTNYYAVRASLVLDLTPDLENYTIASYSRSDTNGDISKVIFARSAGLGPLAQDQLNNEAGKGAGFFTVQSTQTSPRTLLTQYQIINTTTWRAADNLTLKNIVSYAELKESFRNPLFGTDFDLGRLLAGFGLAQPNAFTGQTINFAYIQPPANLDSADQDTITEEFQAQGNALEGKLNYQGGAYLEVSQPLGRSGSQTPVFLNCSSAETLTCANPFGALNAAAVNAGSVNYTVGRTKFHDVGVYSQATYSLTDQLKVTGGVRYTWDRERTDSILRSYTFAPGVIQEQPNGVSCNNPDTEPSCQVLAREKSQKPTWLADVDYKPTEDILLYAKYARGYRAGGIAPQAPTELLTFGPEKVDTYEGGLKTTFRGALRGTFNVAGFYNNFSNQQLQIDLNQNLAACGGAGQPTCPTPSSAIQNAGKSRIWGIEAETSLTPFRGFTLDGSYTYLNDKIRKITTVTLPVTSVFTTAGSETQVGDPLRLTPKHKLSVTGTYTLPLDESVGRVSLGATYTYISRMVTNYAYRNTGGNLDSFSYLPKKSLVNLNLNWNSVAGTRFDVSGFVTNLTNKKYFTYISGLVNSVNFEVASIGEPRMYGARLRYRFGG
jgi:iron complex outermembrane receptor protein